MSATPTVPGYSLLRRLGEGQSGEVWLAEQLSTHRLVAVKLYQRRGPDLGLLRREVEHLAQLATAREVVQLIDVGWEASPPYCVMEYLPRGSLEDLLVARGALPVNEALLLVRRLSRALFHMHARGVCHCDLKPANVLLDESGRPLLCDLGQARLSGETDPALGTFFYMAPEQVAPGAVPSPRWDVYALGAILYRTLTGELPQQLLDDPVTAACMLAYISDWTVLDPVQVAVGKTWQEMATMASLDHAIWFHRPVDFSDWLRYDQRSPSVSGGVGLGIGAIYQRDGTLLATVTQEGFLGPRTS